MSLSVDIIRQLKGQIIKAADAGQSSVVDDILGQLAPLVATTEILKATGIGLAMNSLRKHQDASDKQRLRAKGILDQWKADVAKAAGSGGDASTNAKPAVKRRVSMHVDVKPESNLGARIAAPSTPTSPSTGRTIESDGMKLESTDDAFRDKCIGFLYAALAHDTTLEGAYILKKAVHLERLTFEDNEKDIGTGYKNRIKTLRFNLTDSNNPDLCNNVLGGDISIPELAAMSTQDMASEERKEEIAKAKKELLDEAMTVNDVDAETDMFQCGKCKQRRTKYYQKQTRSADEPMTTFVTCVNCGKKWKFC
ncbi:RNA polymerase II elongation factor [Thoreauomyces humboldtii]|nr:RNA polymerase II elongation factor [Thoreauomyces humboldtii]